MEVILDKNKRYTYADYLTWLDDKRRELINGFVHLMSPAASEPHAKISGNIYWAIRNFIKKNKGGCRIYTAPFDVRLPANGEKEHNKIYSVVQPDICVVCDLSKIDKRGCLGAPDLIVEILSPSTQRYDLTGKYDLYESSGVREYWTVSPGDQSVCIYLLQPDGKYDEGAVYEIETTEIPVHIFDGLHLKWEDIFGD